MKPIRLAIAQVACRPLPPLFAEKHYRKLYDLEQGAADAYEYTIRAPTGSVFHGNTTDRLFLKFGVLGYNAWSNLAIALAVCQPGDHIVEVGANVGTETIGFSDIAGATGKVSAFEPVPSNCEFLAKAIADCQYRNIDIYPYALSDEEGEISFVAPPSAQESGIGYILAKEDGNRSDQQVITVRSVTLDSLELPPATAMFLDVEGAEPRVLQGAMNYIKTNQPYMVLEVQASHLERQGFTIDYLCDQLESLNYEPFRIKKASLKAADRQSRGLMNWLCVPAAKLDRVPAIKEMLRKCARLPIILGINPLGRKR